MLKFEQYLQKINEDATANASVAGMGPVVTAQVGSVSGAAYTGDGTTGSGDIGIPLFKPSDKYSINSYSQFKNKTNRFKRKRKKK